MQYAHAAAGDLADKWHINDLIAEALLPAIK